MNTSQQSGYGLFVCPLVILMGFGLLGITPIPSMRQTNRIELKLDSLPASASVSTSLMPVSAVQMQLDDGHPELAYGVVDNGYAYQFIWFNRFTPQLSDFPFVLKEIWVLFDDDNLESGIFMGDQVDLVVYTDPDGNPSNGATWLATYPTQIEAVDGVTWTIYNLSPPLRLTSPGDVLIGVINRFVTSGISDLSYPAAFDTNAGQDRSWLAWWESDPSDPPELITGGTMMLMTGENAGNWLVRGYGDTVALNVYLPFIQRESILPSTPSLYDIENSDGDGAYQLIWSASSDATSYALQEDDTAGFSSPVGVYTGPGTNHAVIGKIPGSYYYRVRAENGAGFSAWSETKNVIVTQPAQQICETHYFGTGGVSYQIQPSGYTEHFTAQNNMHVETLEVKSFLRAENSMYAYIYISVNSVQIASSMPWVNSPAYTAYTFNRNVSTDLHTGDDITYYITKAVGDPTLVIRWGNYVMLCGSPIN